MRRNSGSNEEYGNGLCPRFMTICSSCFATCSTIFPLRHGSAHRPSGITATRRPPPPEYNRRLPPQEQGSLASTHSARISSQQDPNRGRENQDFLFTNPSSLLPSNTHGLNQQNVPETNSTANPLNNINHQAINRNRHNPQTGHKTPILFLTQLPHKHDQET